MDQQQYRDMMDALTEAAKERAMVREILLGDPADPAKPGLAIRLDRVERQIAQWQQRIAWIGGGSLVTALAGVGLIWWIGQMLAAHLGVLPK